MNIKIDNISKPRPIVDAVITDKNKGILVVDKIKKDWRVLTILPWWKLEDWETDIDCLIREIQEEIWIQINSSEIWDLLWIIKWESPSSNILSEVSLYQLNTEVVISDIILEKGLENPRFLSLPEIFTLSTTTNLTKLSIKSILNTTKIDLVFWWSKHIIEIARNDEQYIISYNNEIYIFPIKKLKFKKSCNIKREIEDIACYIEELEYINWRGNNKNTALYNFLWNFVTHITEKKISWKDFIEILVGN